MIRGRDTTSGREYVRMGALEWVALLAASIGPVGTITGFAIVTYADFVRLQTTVEEIHDQLGSLRDGMRHAGDAVAAQDKLIDELHARVARLEAKPGSLSP